MPDRDAFRLRVYGTVQGVGFRWFVRRAAEDSGVHGWVRNLDDGSVELFATGAADAVEAFARRVASGPSGARVDRVERREAGHEDLGPGFHIRRDAGAEPWG